MTTTDDFDQFEEAPVRKAPAKKAATKRAPRKAARPANAPEPQDRKPKKAVQSGEPARRHEASGVKTVEVDDDRGFTAVIPAHQGDWPLRCAQYFSQGRHLDAIEILLGTEQWEAYLDTEPTVNDGAHLGRRVAEAVGLVDAGN